MTTVAFESRRLPPRVADPLRARLRTAHRTAPFSAADPREAVRRAATVAAELGLTGTVYRGGLDLRGSEVDHVWLDVDGHVVDVAFPLFVAEFVAVLRDFVAGHVAAGDLAAVAALAGVEARVLGEFPPPLRYRGCPVWSARRQQERPDPR